MTQVHTEAGQSRLQLPGRAPALLLSAYVLFCMVMLTQGARTALAGVFLLVSATLVCVTLRSPLTIFLLALPSFFLTASTGALRVSAWLLSFCLGSGYGAFLLCSVGPMKLLPLLVLAPGSALLLGATALEAVLTLLPVPTAVVLYLAYRSELTRTEAICRVAGTALATLLAVGLWEGFSSYGSAFFARLPGLIDEGRTALAEILSRMLAQNPEVGQTMGELTSERLAASFFNVLPAIGLIAVTTCAFYADMVGLSLFRSFGMEKALPRRVFAFSLSLLAAILFLAAYLLSLVLGSTAKGEMIAVICENLYLILLPGTVYAGIMALLSRFFVSRHKGLMLLVLFFALMSSVSLLVILLALWGAVSVLVYAFRRTEAWGGDGSGDENENGNGNGNGNGENGAGKP